MSGRAAIGQAAGGQPATGGPAPCAAPAQAEARGVTARAPAAATGQDAPPDLAARDGSALAAPALALATPEAAALAARLRGALALSRGDSSDFDLSPEAPPPVARLRPAGVLIGITEAQQVLLTKRSSHLRHHAGQIAFPGGKVDAGDQGAIGAALREAQEEIGLPPGAAQVLGTLPAHRTVTAFQVTPVLALVGPFTPRRRPEEVEEVFTVPLAHLLDRARYRVHGRLWQGQMRRYYAIPWGPYYIWGATARILRALAERMA